ncbi:DUF3489 domain-containing protein [Phreatobacter oligotrophus]|uniref:Uncharacterized protein DUF3489 n=1 Tax=Phreatobacter oligotrophus TaxID=1122261 RepID=A0A2T4YY57_9HYPH|nr:DUF3489 domain-containing protein [Phreatobacter oligotrophus]PTM51465.1 uncharacterized protein DUF3489 [Phreatobacter oligotrophus]
MTTTTKTKAKAARPTRSALTPHAASDIDRNGAQSPEPSGVTEPSPPPAATLASTSPLAATGKQAKAVVRAKANNNVLLAEHLTDQQLVALSKACQHDDRTIAIPESLEDEAIGSFATSLIAVGLAEETIAKRGEPVWQQDDETGEPITLRVTDKAFAVLGIDDGLESGDASTGVTEGEIAAGVIPNEDHVGGEDRVERARPNRQPTAESGTPEPRPRHPRPGSKQSTLIAMLSREDGASIAELAVALGWLPHTTRAALTGLRHKGYTLGREARTDQRGSIYRITETPVSATTQDAARIAAAA